MKHGQWMLNKEFGEEWGACEYFDTKQEAVVYGVNLLKKYNSLNNDEKSDMDLSDGLNMYPDDCESIHVFYVGQIESVPFPDMTDNLIELIAEDVYEEAGDYAENYLTDVTDEHQKELADLIQEWAKRHDYLPTCFTIGQTEEIDIRVTEEVGDVG